MCGMKYSETDLNHLELSPVDKLFMCAACDNGVVVPDDPLSQSEVSGERRIKSARQRREAATAQRVALMSALKPLDNMLSTLENVDPPDFGSFTDWAQRRQEMLATGAARGNASPYGCALVQSGSAPLARQLIRLARLTAVHMQRLVATGVEARLVDTWTMASMAHWLGMLVLPWRLEEMMHQQQNGRT